MALAQVDIFGRKRFNQLKPITADMVTIAWGSDTTGTTTPVILSTATNISIQYQQQVIRRRTLGSAA